jgi:hypothetical protein
VVLDHETSLWFAAFDDVKLIVAFGIGERMAFGKSDMSAELEA